MNNKESFFNRPMVSAALVISLGIVLAAVVAALTFYRIRSFDNTLVVTGSAKTTVQADSVRWTSQISRTVPESSLQSAYAQMARDGQVVQVFLKEKGVPSESVTVTPIFVEQMYKYDNQGGPTEYTLRQGFTVNSADIPKITNLAQNTQEIINKGIIFSAQAPEYYYSKLADLRVDLLEDAIKDAKARAGKLAESSGRRVGVLKSASSGVTQVLAPNSIDVSDYGQYDTSSIEKDVMITVRATFVVR